MPVCKAVVLLIMGFCWADEKPLSPAQMYATPPFAVSNKSLPKQRGLVVLALAKAWFMITVVVANAVQPLLLVTVTV